ncbi:MULTISPECIES: helix-turn-helix transcriptional regulator [Dellaglioa]|uniref:Transcriptional regulator n=2 Tax=Dellaglioa TaxID=2767880 RepID=A0A5C6MB31_9LACO|nr:MULTISPECIES: helix-turn-helix transcriptional regulator [Dellaglioa]MCZ2491504.1 helix-turn-helix transcriptional regulator [Dellaglioa carnosa]MCZ2492067.1 helix-turn-helix transcriptional regulator [Dellaglioa carnosa]MCZ2494581.1 helix-turn-helix transcriptional regulator [Dellaglioa carnosa]MDK1717060.1 helix-turn-helix transcriptional regulator [Dellaglioa algida]MDK1719870.1 helix-turn-helix transcriptional regulator [Dellaglioa algida]
MQNKIKQYRTQLDLTQEQLAEKVQVSSRTIISLEKGKYKPSIMLAYRLSLLFDCRIEDLFQLKENLALEES